MKITILDSFTAKVRLLMLLAIILLSACTDNDDNPSGTPQPPAVDVGPSFAEKTVDVSRDGNAYGQVAIRFYSDMPSVPYISVADFHRVMTGGEMMKVSRQGSLYQLTTRDGTATVDVKDDYLFSTSYGGFVNLMWLLDPTLPPNAMHDGSKYLKLVKMEHPSMFKPVNGVRLDFKKYQINLHDGGHTSIHARAGVPDNVKDDYEKRMMTVASNYPEAVGLYNRWTELRNEYLNAKNQLAALCKQAYGDVLYKANSDKTLGVIIMDSFGDQDTAAWDKYYASAKGDADWQELMKNYKKDNFIAFLYALGQAKADGVKNLILDISQNSGGSDDIVTADVALLRKNRTVEYWSQDVLEGKNNISTYVVDTNFDGVFDERDDTHPKFDCSGMNIAVLSSKVSFSCGNIFPCAMKDYGFPIMGERSGGGPCCIQVMLTPDGQHYVISTYRDRATTKDFAGIDTGIAPNDGYAFDYANFYNLEFLGTKINECYSR